MENHDGHHVAIQIEAMLADTPPLSTDECCIYRVPHRIRKFNQEAYTPKIVSIGPFHHGINTQLLNMEGLKQVYSQKFIERSEATLHDLVTCVQELEPKVRRCYSEKIELSVEQLTKVILVDSCFILELLWRYFNNYDQSMPWLMTDIRWDLWLLENQLPFFVFEKLYNSAFASFLNLGRQHSTFMQLASHYLLPFDTEIEEFPPSGSITHFLDLYRYSYLQPSNRLPERGEGILYHLYSATELNEAGVKFGVNEGIGLIDFQLSGNCLRIPQFVVQDSTEMLLRNMVAFEQCHYPNESYIFDYVQVLDFLINTEKDVDILVKNGIIRNWIGDNNEVAELFNGLCKNIQIASVSNIDYLGICRELNAYYEHPWHSKMATLRRDYCNTPWRTVASIAAIVLLILTIVQTVCSIQQVV